jgi:hypothetical protein
LGDLLVVQTLSGGEDNTRATRQPLSAARPARQMHEHFLLAFGEYDRLRSWSWHIGRSLRIAFPVVSQPSDQV